MYEGKDCFAVGNKPRHGNLFDKLREERLGERLAFDVTCHMTTKETI